TVGSSLRVGSSPIRNGENANPWMRTGHGGSAVGRLRKAQTANVRVAKAAAISRPGKAFMKLRARRGSHHTQKAIGSVARALKPEVFGSPARGCARGRS